VKAVDSILQVHQAQLLNYLKATGYRIGLLINFTYPKAEIKTIHFVATDPYVKKRKKRIGATDPHGQKLDKKIAGYNPYEQKIMGLNSWW
jgi:hypothetical protein